MARVWNGADFELNLFNINNFPDSRYSLCSAWSSRQDTILRGELGQGAGAGGWGWGRLIMFGDLVLHRRGLYIAVLGTEQQLNSKLS